ncbi:MAG TPA: DUF6178 family protein [Oligoflexia bacterium]|nr:DUF6178 family protein [Oligoflexia bacterium]HMP27512.1 DUF6178 family protein [Oligoflexia bacterium]
MNNSKRHLLNSDNLYRTIRSADIPEEFAKQLPAQSIYQIILKRGIASAVELIDLCDQSQLQTILDFDLWKRDRIDEDRFFEWLEIGDAEDGLKILQMVFANVDLKIIGFLVNRYVDVIYLEERSETPPNLNFYSPDGGYTWVKVKLDDTRKHFLFSRFLAIAFETSTEIFFQILALRLTQTESMLEESAFEERGRRLSAEGVPDYEWAKQLTSKLSLNEAKKMLASHSKIADPSALRAVAPFAYDSDLPMPLAEIFRGENNNDELLGELALLVNALFVVRGADYRKLEEIEAITSYAKERLNQGLKKLIQESGLDALTIYKAIGLIPIFRVALE